MGERYDSTRWTGEIGTATLPPKLKHAKKAPVISADQNRAFAQVAYLMFSPLVYLVASMIVGAGSSDYLIESPLPNGSGYLPLVAALILFLLVSKNVLVVPFRWIALAASIAVVAGSVAYAGLGLAARADAAVGPALRALPIDQKCRGRHLFRTCTTRFALQDGSSVTVASRSLFGVGRSCYRVHRIDGGRFAWLRLVDWSSGPGPGQLAWPIDRVECFSSADLSTLGR